MKNFKFSHVPYIVIIILLIVITCQSGKTPIERVQTIVKVDTVYKYIEIHDTVPGKIIYLRGKKDTTWINRTAYVPKLTYDSLLEQYKSLGNSLFKTNVYSTKFNIKDFGYVSVIDTISQNKLTSSELQSFLTIPVKTITVTEREAPRRQVYVGMILMGNKTDILSSAHVSGLYKDKKDRLFGGSLGVSQQGIQYGVSSYLKIRLRR